MGYDDEEEVGESFDETTGEDEDMPEGIANDFGLDEEDPDKDS